jgi:hypothetical protein
MIGFIHYKKRKKVLRFYTMHSIIKIDKGGEKVEGLGKIIALAISILTLRQIWLSNQKTKLEIKKLEQELRKIRRGG